MLDKATGTNRPDEHRAWCRYRKADDEHVRNIALARTLTTQGAVIRLPQSVTIGDQFAIPSLAAALLLGLHEQIGGSPDHIDDRGRSANLSSATTARRPTRSCCTTSSPAAPAT